MAETKRAELKIVDLTDAIKEANGLVKENYLAGFELTFSLWIEGLKVLSSQLDRWPVLQQDYTNFMTTLSEKSPSEAVKIWSEALSTQIDWFTSLQKEYMESVKSMSDKFTNDLVNLSQKNIERASSAFSSYLSLFGI